MENYGTLSWNLCRCPKIPYKPITELIRNKLPQITSTPTFKYHKTTSWSCPGCVMAKRPPLMQGTRSVPSSSQLNCSLQSNIIFTWDDAQNVAENVAERGLQSEVFLQRVEWKNSGSGTLLWFCLISDHLPKELEDRYMMIYDDLW